MILEIINHLDELRLETECLCRENRRQRAIAAARLARLSDLIGETVAAHCAAASQLTEMKAWLEDWTAKSRSKF